MPRLRYRLHGYDRHWRNLAPQSESRVQYTNLPPGDYRFEVVDAATPEPHQAAMIDFRIAPWFHETWLFRLLVAAAVVAGLVLLLHYGNRRHLQRRQALEQEVALRTTELRQAYQRLESISRTDALTGLYNRRHAGEEIPARLGRLDIDGTADAGEAVLLVLLDVDRFKSINDTWGHHEGDQVLAEVARRLAAQTRGSDCLARWGGEEFLLACFGLDPAQSEAIGERLCECIRAEPFVLGGVPRRVTISAGLASVSRDGAATMAADWEQLVRTADQALYMAKHQGRDRWVLLQAEDTGGLDTGAPVLARGAG